MRQTMRVLMTVLALCVGFVVASGPAEAASAGPWAFVRVSADAQATADTLYLPMTVYCPSGDTPISGGISGAEPFYVLNEYATYWNDSFSEQLYEPSPGAYTLTAECAPAAQVGTVQVVSADFARNASGEAGGWVPCPNGTRAIGGGADWNMSGVPRGIQYSAPSNDGLSWYATGYSTNSGDSLHVEAYCVAASELAGAQLVVQAYTDPSYGASLLAACPNDTRVLTGGVYAALPGSGVDPGQFVGWTQSSYTDPYRLGWHSTTPFVLPASSTVYVTAWCVPASIPTVVITAGPPAATTQTFAQFAFAAADPAGYELTIVCELDGIQSDCDSPSGTGYSQLGEGSHTFGVWVYNADGEQAIAFYHWTVDTTSPTVTTTAPAQPFTLADSTTVSWTGQENPGGSGIAHYQVRERSAAYNSGFAAWTYPAGWQALNPDTTSITAKGLRQGVDYCFAARAIDQAGNTSPWTTPRCTARALDDRALTISADWARGTGRNYWNHTVTSTSTHAGTATRTGAQLDRAGIVATRGPGMGTIALYVGANRIGQVNLVATTTHYQSLILLPPFSYRTGAVRVKVISHGKTVQLDGLAISRS
jgi:hypothetical protein